MRSIHVLRKPCSEGTVAANVLRHGTGALNIDATRIGYEHTPNPATNPLFRKVACYKNTNASDANSSSYSLKDGSGERNPNAGGRWPANIVLQHLDGCVQEGTKKVKGQNPQYASDGKGEIGLHVYNRYNRSWGTRPARTGIGHADPDGTETVAAWACVEGCPVAALDAQSGVSKSTGGRAVDQFRDRNPIYGGGRGMEEPRDPGFGDMGGASRFFKQVKP